MSVDHIFDTNSLDNATAYKLYRTARLLRFHLNKFFQQVGVDLTLEQWFILFRLYEKDGRSQGELADKDLQDHPNVTRILDTLQKNKWVQRAPDPNDRRRHLVYLTDAGRVLMADMLPQVVAERQRIFANISNEEVEAFTNTLQKIERNL